MESARDRLYGMVSGFRVTQLVRAAAELGLCDLLAEGPLTAAQVASRLRGNEGLLHRFMRSLAGQGILVQVDAGRFANSEIGDLLRSGVPGSMRHQALSLPDHPSWLAWSQLTPSLLDGAVPYERANGVSFWEANARDASLGKRFNQFMVAQTEAFVPGLLGEFDLSSCRQVVDVGGGNGALLAGILAAHEHLRGTLFDLEQGLSGAPRYLEARGVRDRCELVTGDFFVSVPAGGDLYILKMILHDWDDPRAVRILTSCRAAMGDGARLLIIEYLLPEMAADSASDRTALLLDMHMHVLFGARERTLRQFEAILQPAGLGISSVLPTEPYRSLVCRASG